MMTSDSLLERKLEQDLVDRVQSVDRYVDASVLLHVVTAAHISGAKTVDVNGRTLYVLRTHARGGIIDTKLAKPTIVGFSDTPREWTCSEEQETALFHTGPTLAQLIYGSEGAGKTTLLCMWHFWRWTQHIGEHREGGQAAPTLARLGLVRQEMLSLFGSDWGRYVSRDEFEGMEMCDGSRIRFKYTKEQSKASGSPWQGFNLSWCGRDEMQDQGIEVHGHIESRGRAAGPDGYQQLATATAKDDSEWRELRDIVLAPPADGSHPRWIKRSLSIFRSPFIDPKFIADKRVSMSAREFLRRYGDPITGEVSDLPPELAVYYGWLRSRNLVALPQIATDVTTAVLSGYRSFVRPGARFSLLAGHDPGVIYNTTELFRLIMFGNVPTWTVVGELQTKQTTVHEHARLLAQYLRDTFNVEFKPSKHEPNPGSKCLVFCDPHGKGEGQTDYNSVYGAFQKEGLDTFNPAPMSGRIKRSARIEMMNRLLGGSAEDKAPPRLVIATDQQGRPVAPKLVEAFEALKKKAGDDDPEGSQRKDIDDKTHGPAATAYGLWMFEQEALTESTMKVALAEARRLR